MFQPASLAIPGMLFAIGLGWLGRPLPAAVVASASSLPHPLYGARVSDRARHRILYTADNAWARFVVSRFRRA